MRRQRPILATVLACALAMPALASAEPMSDAAVRLEVDVSKLPKDRLAEDTRTWVLKHQTTAFEEAGFTVTEDASRVVRIEISRYGEYGMHSKARLMVVGDEDMTREFTCEACRDSQFLDKVSQETAALAEQLRSELEASREPAEEQQPAVEQEPAPAAEDDGTEPAQSEDPTDHEGKPLGAAGFAGIASLSLGAGLTIGGVIVAVSEPDVQLQVQDDHLYERTSRRPLGIGLVAAGASLLVAGAVLVAVDQTILRKRREQRRASAALLPSLTPTGAGLVLTGRF